MRAKNDERRLGLDAADRSWFEPLARTLERPAYHFAVMLVRNRATAEELVQEAFARVWASPNTPSTEPDFHYAYGGAQASGSVTVTAP